jgi:hypothetical protein
MVDCKHQVLMFETLIVNSLAHKTFVIIGCVYVAKMQRNFVVHCEITWHFLGLIY